MERGSAMGLRPFTPKADTPLSEQLYAHLRTAIRRGELAPGQRLVEDSIAAATSVSRTPVREALRKLVSTGLAVNGGRGLVVAKLSADELQEIFQVMTSLWGTAAWLAAENRSDADIAEMRYILRTGQSTSGQDGGEGRLDEVFQNFRLNELFRNCLLRAAGNRYLADLLSRVVVQTQSLVELTVTSHQADLAAGLENVVDAIERRDAEGAQAAAQKRLAALLETILIQMHATAGVDGA